MLSEKRPFCPIGLNICTEDTRGNCYLAKLVTSQIRDGGLSDSTIERLKQRTQQQVGDCKHPEKLQNVLQRTPARK